MEHTLHYTKMETPIGPVIACAGNMVLSLLELYDEATPVVIIGYRKRAEAKPEGFPQCLS